MRLAPDLNYSGESLYSCASGRAVTRECMMAVDVYVDITSSLKAPNVLPLLLPSGIGRRKVKGNGGSEERKKSYPEEKFQIMRGLSLHVFRAVERSENWSGIKMVIK